MLKRPAPAGRFPFKGLTPKALLNPAFSLCIPAKKCNFTVLLKEAPGNAWKRLLMETARCLAR